MEEKPHIEPLTDLVADVSSEVIEKLIDDEKWEHLTQFGLGLKLFSNSCLVIAQEKRRERPEAATLADWLNAAKRN